MERTVAYVGRKQLSRAPVGSPVLFSTRGATDDRLLLDTALLQWISEYALIPLQAVQYRT